jgi:SAM-dependent methyltransferase
VDPSVWRRTHGGPAGTLCGMEGAPDDAAARREALDRWAAEQQRRVLLNRWAAERSQARVRSRTRLRAAELRLANRLERFASRVLDRGLDTSGYAIEPEHQHPDRTRYVPSAWHVLPRALRYLGVSDRDVFVDFGCGKGRVVHQAARWPFCRVIGVEISPSLAEIARTALAARRHQHRCRDVEIVVSDATEYRVPDDLTIGYLYHPFKGETFDTVLGGIIDSIDRHPRRVRLIYVWPLESARSQILATGRFRVLKEQRTRFLDSHVSRAVIFESC